jgi:hypothetical protein
MKTSFKTQVMRTLLSQDKFCEKVQALIEQAGEMYHLHGNTDKLATLRLALEERAAAPDAKRASHTLLREVTKYLHECAPTLRWDDKKKVYLGTKGQGHDFTVKTPYYKVADTKLEVVKPLTEQDCKDAVLETLARRAKKGSLEAEVMLQLLSDFVTSKQFEASFAREYNERLASRLSKEVSAA